MKPYKKPCTALYMQVTNDKYELPLTPPMHADELAKLTGFSKFTIYCRACNSKRKPKRESSIAFVKVDIDSDD